MTLINKHRFLNKYILMSIILMLSIMILSYLIESNIIDHLFFDNYSDVPAKQVLQSKNLLINQELNWNFYHICSNIYTPLFYPLFATLPILSFFKEKNGYFKQMYMKVKNYKSSVYKIIFLYAAISGLAVMTGYILFILMGKFCFRLSKGADVGMFTDVFPNLMSNNPLLGGILHAFSIYFVFGFVFGLFGICVALKTEKSYMVIIIPHLYYLISGNIFSTISSATNLDFFNHLSPWFPVTVTGLSHTKVFNPYISLLPILAVCLIYIGWRVGHGNKIGY